MSDPRDEALARINAAMRAFADEELDANDTLLAVESALSRFACAPTPRRRRVVQVAVARAFHGVEQTCLCDDGSMWASCGSEWFRLPDVPQDEEEGES